MRQKSSLPQNQPTGVHQNPKTMMILETKPLATEQEPVNLTLSGIMTDGAKRVALINGSILKEGDSIEGKRISKILEDKVEILDGTQTISLTIKH